MTETKVPKMRRSKKDMGRTDDVAHALAAMPAMQHARGSEALGGHLVPSYGIDEDERRRMIAEAAYYRALQRGFANGSPETDWLEAEAEVVALLSGAGVRA